jgi:hypothetical protein
MSDEELRKRLKEQVRHFRQILEHDPPAKIAANVLARIVVTSRLLFGEEVIEAEMDSCQTESDATEAGLCPNCQKNPSSELAEESPYCAQCVQELDRDIAQITREIVIEELMDKDDEGPTH